MTNGTLGTEKLPDPTGAPVIVMPPDGGQRDRLPGGGRRNGLPDRSSDCLRNDLVAGHLEGAAFGGMVGLGETYLPAFALAVGLGEITAGMVASVPLLAGGLMQAFSPLAIRRLGSHKRWVLACALAQTLSFAPLVLAAITGRISAAGILVAAAVYWGTGLATGPAWNTWMGNLVPRPVRARFFARRTSISQLTVLIGLLLGGGLLQWANSRDAVPQAFSVLFVAAAICRLVSLGLLAIQREPRGSRNLMPAVAIGRIWSQVRQAGSGRLVLYLVVVQGAVQFAGPYFTPFMFRWLHLSYTGYVILIATAFLAKVVTLSVWGNLAHRVGAARLLWIGGIGITPVSAMWIASDDFFWLIFIQAVAGVFWGAYELGFFLMFFEAIPEDERTGVLTFYNLANSTTWVLGSALGGLFLYLLGTGPAAYLTLFGVSSIGRGVALLLLRRVQPTSEVPSAAIGVRTVAVRPMAASVDAPILPSLPDQTDDLTQEVATAVTIL